MSYCDWSYLAFTYPREVFELGFAAWGRKTDGGRGDVIRQDRVQGLARKGPD